MTLHPIFARILSAHGAPAPRPFYADQQRIHVDARLTDAQRVAAIEGILAKQDGEAISLTFRMDADLRAILVGQLAQLRDALRATLEDDDGDDTCPHGRAGFETCISCRLAEGGL